MTRWKINLRDGSLGKDCTIDFMSAIADGVYVPCFARGVYFLDNRDGRRQWYKEAKISFFGGLATGTRFYVTWVELPGGRGRIKLSGFSRGSDRELWSLEPEYYEDTVSISAVNNLIFFTASPPRSQNLQI